MDTLISVDDGGSFDRVDGPQDIAAALAVRDWERSAVGRAWSELEGVAEHLHMDRVRDGAPRAELEALLAMHFTTFLAIEHGARIGYALAMASAERRGGWRDWPEVARVVLHESGCDADAHNEHAREAIADALEGLRNARP